MKNQCILLISMLLCSISFSYAQKSSLYKEIDLITRNKNATVGMAVIWDNGDTLTVNNNRQYPMMSVVKFPLALGVLHFLEQNGISLDTSIHITAEDLPANTYSPLRELYPEGGIKISIRELIRYSVALSDNNACDILFRFVGGPGYVQAYMLELGIPDMLIRADEEILHLSFDHQYLNYNTPYAAALLLNKFLNEEILSRDHYLFLRETMIKTATGRDKLKALLPDEAILGHKTGSSSRSAHGLKAADNDIGFVVKPDGRSYCIAVFVMDSKESDKVDAAIIAAISKAVYDHIP